MICLLNALRFLHYLLRHKWGVFVMCCEAGIVWRGVRHDCDKFSPVYLFAYGDFMFGAGPTDEQVNVTRRRLRKLHHRTHDHHWQFWANPDNTARDMCDEAITEMLCDWETIYRTGTGVKAEEYLEQKKGQLAFSPETWRRFMIGLAYLRKHGRVSLRALRQEWQKI